MKKNTNENNVNCSEEEKTIEDFKENEKKGFLF